MTFEEFKRLALNPPRREEPTIFEVIEYDIIPPSEDQEPPYEKLDVSKNRIGFGHTLEEAEGLMRRAIEEADENGSDIYCFHIREYPVGVDMSGSYCDLGVTTRLYDEYGELLDRTYCSDLDRDYGTKFGHFRGRATEQRRFRQGETVEFLTDDEIRLVEVGSDGPSIEWCWGFRERIKDEPRFQKNDGSSLTEEEIDRLYRIDCSDDQITIYFDNFDSDDDEAVCRGGESYRDHAHVNPLFLRHLTGCLEACYTK